MIAIAAGFGHSIALRSNGTVVAWGDNTYHQLGDGTDTTSLVPVQVCAVGEVAPCGRFLSGVTAIAAGGFHSLAILRNGTVVSWGWNGEGQLGDGTFDQRLVPVQVCAVGQVAPCGQFLSGVSGIAAGGLHSLARLGASSAVVSWGWNADGQLGNGTTTESPVPVRVCAVGQVAPCSQFLTTARTLAGGYWHSLAVVGNADAVGWGYNGEGELGDGTTTSRSTPVRVCAVGQVAPCSRFLTAVNAVSAGANHSLARLGDGSVVSWGYNALGQLGDGTTTTRLTPVRVCAVGETAPCTRFLYQVRIIAAGADHSMAQLSSGGVITWGYNAEGQLGDGTTTSRSVPVRVCAVGEVAPCTRFLILIRGIAAGTFHSMALQPNYTVATWGGNSFGQLGDGTTENRLTPVQVLAPAT
ncbi:RCC1 domain-containing protein [Micromonospora cathayae]|uniref:Alpha-tubulin suppressor n=1 Tax=Micromonospora cathayae TaxID=3028804 RepID=A0ABY7ZRI8_9ACTN|nr:RCC1 domain-containing protein [Micromonospora sp. HUAS 3]WDZ84569.1 hypothetical protein PVK37_29745 [Micromonospora sp. HUAS 3]